MVPLTQLACADRADDICNNLLFGIVMAEMMMMAVIGIAGCCVISSASAATVMLIPELQFWNPQTPNGGSGGGGGQAPTGPTVDIDGQTWDKASVPNNANKIVSGGCDFWGSTYNVTRRKWMCFLNKKRKWLDTGVKKGMQCTMKKECIGVAANAKPADAAAAAATPTVTVPVHTSAPLKDFLACAAGMKPKCRDGATYKNESKYDLNGYCEWFNSEEWNQEAPECVPK